MPIDEIKSLMTTLKIHIDQIEIWTRQATDLVYLIEDNISKKYEAEDNIEFLKLAATGIQITDCPPRLNSSRCSNDHSAAAGFFQSDFELNKNL